MAKYDRELGAYLLEGMESKKERKENSREVARVFALRSRPSGQIMFKILEGENPAHFSFTSMMWAEKGMDSKENASQLMPVGGKKDEGELLETTAVRELLEETHLRSTRLEYLGEMGYSHEHSKQGKINIDAGFFVCDILPTDVAFPLYPEEDKLESFHYLEESELENLFIEGKIKIGGHEFKILDSLQSFPRVTKPTANIELPEVEVSPKKKTRNKKDISAGEEPRRVEQAVNIQLRLVDAFQKKDFLKKKDIFLRLLRQIDEHDLEYAGEAEEWLFKMSEAKDIGEINRVYGKFWEKYGDSETIKEKLTKAFDFSNFAEEVESHHAGTSVVEADLRFVYTLLETHFQDDEYLEIARQSPRLKVFVEKLESFIGPMDGDNFWDKCDNLNLKMDNEEEAEEIEKNFCEIFGICAGEGCVPQEEFTDRMEGVNRFLNYIVDNAIKPSTKGQYRDTLIRSLNEVKLLSLREILQLAFPGGNRELLNKFDDKHIVVFEARRQLVLLHLLSATDRFYEEEKRKGVAPIQRIYSKSEFIKGPNTPRYLEDVHDENGRLVDVRVWSPTDADQAKSANLRTAHLHPVSLGDQSFLAEIEVPDLKREESLDRKILERGWDDPKNARDINRRTINIVECDLQRVNIAEDEKMSEYIAEGIISYEKKIPEEAKNDLSAVLAILKEIVRMGNLKGESVKIVDYKPTPQPNKKMISSSEGGGGEIRLAKFYTEHTDKDGVVRYEEVQVYTPSLDGRSAFYWQTKKKEDDERYFMDRLLVTKGLRSLLDLLFPIRLYPVQDVHKKRS